MKKESIRLVEDHQLDWWINSRAEIVLTVLSRIVPKSASILDVGSGIGLIATYLVDSGYKGIETSDSSNEALSILEKKGLHPHAIHLPKVIPKKKFDAFLLLDVLEHVEEDKETLSQLKGCLKGGGYGVITVPALPWLWSKKDDEYLHKRRYTKKTLQAVIKESGLEVVYLTYYNFFLFLPAVIFSLRNKNHMKVKRYNSPLNKPFYNIFKQEKHLLARRLHFPIGVSLFAIVRRAK